MSIYTRKNTVAPSNPAPVAPEKSTQFIPTTQSLAFKSAHNDNGIVKDGFEFMLIAQIQNAQKTSKTGGLTFSDILSFYVDKGRLPQEQADIVLSLASNDQIKEQIVYFVQNNEISKEFLQKYMQLHAKREGQHIADFNLGDGLQVIANNTIQDMFANFENNAYLTMPKDLSDIWRTINQKYGIAKHVAYIRTLHTSVTEKNFVQFTIFLFNDFGVICYQDKELSGKAGTHLYQRVTHNELMAINDKYAKEGRLEIPQSRPDKESVLTSPVSMYNGLAE